MGTSSPNKSQTTFITAIKNVLSSKESSSRTCNGEIAGCSRWDFYHCGCEGQVSLFRDKGFPNRCPLGSLQCRSSGLGKASGGSLQSAEPLVNQGEERFERISRAKFNVDTPDAERQAGCNFKESQTNLADRGNFEFGAP